MASEFVYVTYISASAEKLWEALTTGDFTHQYWGGRRIESDWKAGSDVKLLKEDGTVDWQGKVLRADRPKVLSYTFEPLPDENRITIEGKKAPDLSEKPSRVTIEITPYNDYVKLTLIHDDFPANSKVLPGISQGWPFILASIKSLLEGGRALAPHWR